MDERSWNSRLRQLAMTLWIGGQWLAGWGVAPILFARLDTQLAGELAGRVFTLVEWLGLACALRRWRRSHSDAPRFSGVAARP